MPISSYPRRACSLVPQILRPLLEAPLPTFWRVGALRDTKRFCDLDAGVWQQVDESSCKILSRDVVRQVAKSLPQFWNALAHQKLPLPATGGAGLNDLELGEDTFTHLRIWWPESQTDGGFLARKTIGEALELPGFGADNLVDLLCSIEELQTPRVVIAEMTDEELGAGQFLSSLYDDPLSILDDDPLSILDGDIEEDLLDELSAQEADRAASAPHSTAFGETVFDLSGAEVENAPSVHNADFGALLQEVDENVDALREQMHRVVALLHHGYDPESGKSALEAMHSALAKLNQGASDLETLTLGTASGWAWSPPLDETLTQLARELHDMASGAEIDSNDPRLPILEEITIPGQQLHEFTLGLLQRTRDPLETRRLKAALEELRHGVELLNAQTVEEELRGILVSLSGRWSAPERKLEILSRRYGLEDGRATVTLQNTAAEFHVSRERIRQIIEPIEHGMTGLSLFAPALDRALEWLEKEAPLAIEEVGPRLQHQGLTLHKMSFEALKRIARLLGREMPVETGLVGQKTWVQSADKQGTTILRLARRQVSRWGLSTVEEITAGLGAQNGAAEEAVGEEMPGDNSQASVSSPEKVARTEMVRRILASQSDFAWLDEDKNWFWFSKTNRNGLITQIDKVMAVAPRIGIGALRAGVSRQHRRQGFAPPGRVLLELCRGLWGLSVEGSEVVVTGRRLSGALSETEELMAQVLREHGAVMQRSEFERLCDEQGVPRGTFYTYIMHSPILDKYAPGIYGLRGAAIEPGVIESLGASGRRGRTRVIKDSGWTTEGKLWLSYGLSQGIIDSGVCSLPGEIRHHLQGRFPLQAADGAPVGAWVGRDQVAWGLGGFLRRRGGEPGDILLLIFDLTARTATIALGDEALIEELQGDASE